MASIPKFDSEIYSEETYSMTEAEYDEVMSDCWQGYSEWSRELEQVRVVAESENFIAYSDGTVRHKPEPKSNGRWGGIEL
jgi:hypothetical protein